jgi:hypothetical protein
MGTGTPQTTGDGRSSRLFHISGWLQPELTEKAEVFTEKIDMSVTE